MINNRFITFIKKFRVAAVLVVLAVTIGLVSFKEADDNTFEISKNLDVFTTLMRELSVYYVDPMDPEPLVHEGIDAML